MASQMGESEVDLSPGSTNWGPAQGLSADGKSNSIKQQAPMSRWESTSVVPRVVGRILIFCEFWGSGIVEGIVGNVNTRHQRLYTRGNIILFPNCARVGCPRYFGKS